ncbi:hypothetical protein V501_07741 [Pseudogymnoascus sp. VKM F-4519 (FW-2642)]|nr:hypothetical protein V501_07741 [Pseudogymnoascus sp. VKM F-4519 (FW-2642)]
MDTKTRYSAARAVLSTPELLEAILLNVNMKTLLLSQRVSRSWGSIMTSSLVIQQALFFRPVQKVSSIIPFDPTDKDNDFGDHDSKIIYNPLLVAKFGSGFFRRGNEGYYTQICHPAKYFYKLPWYARNAAYVNIDAWDEVSDEDEPGPEVIAEEKAIRRCFTRSGASWRQMLVSQPPPPLRGYCWADLSPAWQTVSTAMVEPSRGGLRMGELYDMVQYHSGHREHNSMKWFPVTQRGLGLRFVFDTQDGVQEMMNEIDFAVEFQHVMGSGMYFREPSDVEAFDAEFRCDDFRYINANTEAVSEKPS